MTERHHVVCRMKSYIQPFERGLAFAELRSLSRGSTAAPLEGDPEGVLFTTCTRRDVDVLRQRLTYWDTVWEGSSTWGSGGPTVQVRREATWAMAKNGKTPSEVVREVTNGGELSLPKQRVLRYGPHGLHEYRGKFFPQLVRSLLNIAGVEEDSVVLDPMCGSGTTLVEAVLLGCSAIGVDLNPLSALMSRAKVGILGKSPDALLAEHEALQRRIERLRSAKAGRSAWSTRLQQRDQEYLRRWFSNDALASLDLISMAVQETKDIECRLIFMMSLSNIIRRVSWQREADLRVRKAVDPEKGVDAVLLFLEETRRSASAIGAMLAADEGRAPGACEVLEGDVRDVGMGLFSRYANRVDVILTSPPYATALPYIDTDRLSLCYLNLLPRGEHRKTERRMIGNREISEGERARLLEVFEEEQGSLPQAVTELVRTVRTLNEGADVGFRRRNSAALLSAYFTEMTGVLSGIRRLLRRGGRAFLIVGSNHTIAGGERVEIATDRLLAEIGESVGLVVEQFMAMEMLASRDIFKKNAGSVETLIEFRKR